MEPIVARKTWRTLEPLHGLIYFAPEADEAYAAVGLRGNRMGYFASRAATMGPVTAPVVVATFYNFNPELVAAAIPEALRLALPDEALTSPDVKEAAELARRAAESAATRPAGRALFAAHAALPWPDDPLLVLWHAQ